MSESDSESSFACVTARRLEQEAEYLPERRFTLWLSVLEPVSPPEVVEDTRDNEEREWAASFVGAENVVTLGKTCPDVCNDGLSNLRNKHGSSQLKNSNSNANMRSSRKPKSASNPSTMSEYFRFEDLPYAARLRVYHYLGFHINSTFKIFTDKTHKTKLSLHDLYKVDLTCDAKISTPWNYDTKQRQKRVTPLIPTNLTLVNQAIRDETYEILYSNSLFVIHFQNYRKPKMPSLSAHACSYITHAVISYNAIPATLTFFNKPSHPLALLEALNEITPLLPNLRYIAINFWSPQLPRLVPEHIGTVAAPTTRDPHAVTLEPNFKDMRFITRALIDLIKSHPTIEIFALLRDMQPRGRLDWNRAKDNATKALSRDIRNCMAKVIDAQETI